MAYSEFYVQTTGSNVNAGSTTADAASFTFTNGAWDGTSVFTAAGADLSGITVGDFASVYNDGATLAVYVGRITAVDDTADTITLSTTAVSGTAPLVGISGKSIKVGGAWKGPNGAVGFPFGFVAGVMTNVAGDSPRVNFKSGTNYAITAAVTHNIAGPTFFQGYTTTPGDLGRAVIDGTIVGASYILLTNSGTRCHFLDFTLQNNGTAGAQAGCSNSGSNVTFYRVVVHDVRGNGFSGTSAAAYFVECEAYNCLSSGFSYIASTSFYYRCISHHNTGASTHGFTSSTNTVYINCIAHDNGAHGFNNSSALCFLQSCDAYDNVSSGLNFSNGSLSRLHVENCNFVKNGGWGVNASGSTRAGFITNCGFGSGSMANTSGNLNALGDIIETGTISYAADVTPWTNPDDGDFRISLAAAKGAGRGSFLQTQSGYGDPNPTVAYPDIGAAQSRGGGGGSFTFVG